MDHDSWMVRIRLEQRHNDGPFLRLSWDPQILVLDNKTTDTKARLFFSLMRLDS